MVCERVSDKLQHVQAKEVIKSTPGNRLISVRLLWALLAACLETMLYFILWTWVGDSLKSNLAIKRPIWHPRRVCRVKGHHRRDGL